jgi:hypothetical protein
MALVNTKNVTVIFMQEIFKQDGTIQFDVTVQLSTGGTIAFKSYAGTLEDCTEIVQTNIHSMQLVFDYLEIKLPFILPKGKICLEKSQLGL